LSDRIDHAVEARKHIEWAHLQQEQDGEYEFTVRDNALIAQAEATLALVEQQRIMNERAQQCPHGDFGLCMSCIVLALQGVVPGS